MICSLTGFALVSIGHPVFEQAPCQNFRRIHAENLFHHGTSAGGVQDDLTKMIHCEADKQVCVTSRDGPKITLERRLCGGMQFFGLDTADLK
jgi:hypothetical protein